MESRHEIFSRHERVAQQIIYYEWKSYRNLEIIKYYMNVLVRICMSKKAQFKIHWRTRMRELVPSVIPPVNR